MRRRKARGVVWTACLFVLAGGCAERTLIVQDEQERPVPGASVLVISPSISYGESHTDARGKLRLKSFYAQDPQWLDIAKAGYEPIKIAFATEWPFTIVLKKEKK